MSKIWSALKGFGNTYALTLSTIAIGTFLVGFFCLFPIVLLVFGSAALAVGIFFILAGVFNEGDM